MLHFQIKLFLKNTPIYLRGLRKVLDRYICRWSIYTFQKIDWTINPQHPILFEQMWPKESIRISLIFPHVPKEKMIETFRRKYKK